MSVRDIIAKGSAKMAADDMFDDLADNYEPYVVRPHPQVAVTFYKANGKRRGFLYHNLRHPAYDPWGDSEIISFTADGLAYVIEGTGLGEMYDFLMLQTLLKVREYDGKPPGKLAARITRIEVADPLDEEESRSKLRLVKD